MDNQLGLTPNRKLLLDYLFRKSTKCTKHIDPSSQLPTSKTSSVDRGSPKGCTVGERKSAVDTQNPNKPKQAEPVGMPLLPEYDRKLDQTTISSNRENFRKEQREDPTLRLLWTLAADPVNTEYQIQDRLLVRFSKNRTDQLCIPSKYRTEILRTAHRNPWAGHLGRKRTGLRILSRFFWPKIYSEIAEMCRGCPEWLNSRSTKPL